MGGGIVDHEKHLENNCST